MRNLKTIKERRKFIEKKKNVSLPAIGEYPKEMEIAQYKNCENMIGCSHIPLGMAGPIPIRGSYARGEYYIPLATTEGALVASVNRGCKAVSLSGGVKVITSFAGITRGSVFKSKGIAESHKLKTWIDDHFQLLSKLADSTSSHLKLLKIETGLFGMNFFVRFSFDTQDAMGMNMVTIAAQKMTEEITRLTGNDCVAVAGNFDVDKKPAWLNFLLGRGRQVWAEVVLSKNTIEEVLKSTPERLHQVALRKCIYGSIISGSLGFNAHYANIIAALFIATGQDVAHTVEGSLGITSTEIVNNGIYTSVYLPDLPIGVVGGGTNLPSQKEALSILGIFGGDHGKNASQFAEIIGGAVLAGEISLLSSLSEGSLALAHKKLARGK